MQRHFNRENFLFSEYNRACSNYRKKQFTEAIAIFKKLIGENYKVDSCTTKIVICYERMGKTKEVGKLFEYLVKKSETDSNIKLHIPLYGYYLRQYLEGHDANTLQLAKKHLDKIKPRDEKQSSILETTWIEYYSVADPAYALSLIEKFMKERPICLVAHPAYSSVYSYYLQLLKKFNRTQEYLNLRRLLIEKINLLSTLNDENYIYRNAIAHLAKIMVETAEDSIEPEIIKHLEYFKRSRKYADIGAHMVLAEAYEKNKDHEESSKIRYEVLEKFPTYWKNYINIACHMDATGEHNKEKIYQLLNAVINAYNPSNEDSPSARCVLSAFVGLARMADTMADKKTANQACAEGLMFAKQVDAENNPILKKYVSKILSRSAKLQDRAERGHMLFDQSMHLDPEGWQKRHGNYSHTYLLPRTEGQTEPHIPGDAPVVPAKIKRRHKNPAVIEAVKVVSKQECMDKLARAEQLTRTFVSLAKNKDENLTVDKISKSTAKVKTLIEIENLAEADSQLNNLIHKLQAKIDYVEALPASLPALPLTSISKPTPSSVSHCSLFGLFAVAAVSTAVVVTSGLYLSSQKTL